MARGPWFIAETILSDHQPQLQSVPTNDRRCDIQPGGESGSMMGHKTKNPASHFDFAGFSAKFWRREGDSNPR
ncbi:protein of unknown function [Paraburkholderia kururiensis]